MSNNNGSKTLIGIKQICGYLECTKPTFYGFIKMGMPARVVNGRWYAHIDNIDGFFKSMTHYQAGAHGEIDKEAT